MNTAEETSGTIIVEGIHGFVIKLSREFRDN